VLATDRPCCLYCEKVSIYLSNSGKTWTLLVKRSTTSNWLRQIVIWHDNVISFNMYDKQHCEWCSLSLHAAGRHVASHHWHWRHPSMNHTHTHIVHINCTRRNLQLFYRLLVVTWLDLAGFVQNDYGVPGFVGQRHVGSLGRRFEGPHLPPCPALGFAQKRVPFLHSVTLQPTLTLILIGPTHCIEYSCNLEGLNRSEYVYKC